MAKPSNEVRAGGEDGQFVKPRVFVSYSRKDTPFAEALVADLGRHGFEAYLDTKLIAPGEPWQDRLAGLIVKADAIAFALSPDSVDPKSVCDWELNEAERLQKRIIPVVCRNVADAEVPGRLKRLNYVFLTPERDRAHELSKLFEALRVDIRWVRRHTDIGEAAERWLQPGTGGDHNLLQGKAIDEAELWISSHPSSAPPPTDFQRSFIKASREAAIARANKERRQIQRTRWFQRAVGVLLAIGLAGVVQQDIDTTRREQAVFSSKAAEAMREERYDRATRFALQSVPPKGAWPWSPSSGLLDGQLGAATMLSRLIETFRHPAQAVETAQFSQDGLLVVSASANAAHVWHTKSGRSIPLSGHRTKIVSAQFERTGTTILTASLDNTARLWDASTGNLVASMVGHDDALNSAAFDRLGERVVTASWDRTAIVWSLDGVPLVRLKGHSSEVKTAVFSPNGDRVVTASRDKTARIWNVTTGEQLYRLEGHGKPLRSAAFNHAGTAVVTTSEDGTARIWNAATGTEIATLQHEGFVQAAVFSPDDQFIATTSFDRTARIWSARGDQVHILKNHRDTVWTAAFSPDGSRLVTASFDGTARIWDLASGRECGVLNAHEGQVNGASFGADGARIVTAADDGTVRIWDGRLGRELNTLDGHRGEISGAAIDSTGIWVATSSEDRTARIWNASTPQAISVLEGHTKSVTSVAISADDAKLATTSEDGTIRLWSSNGGTPLGMIELDGVTATHRAAFDATGRKIALSGPNARIVSIDAPATPMLFDGHRSSVATATFSPDGSKLLTASTDDTAALWDSKSRDRVVSFKGHADDIEHAAFNAHGTLVVTASADDTAIIWNAATGEPKRALIGHVDNVSSAVFSADGSLIVTASWDDTARFWDPDSGLEMGRLATHTGFLRGAVLSKDQTRLVTFGGSDKAKVWDTTWIARHGATLRDSVCKSISSNTLEFTDSELADPVMSTIGKSDLGARNPCLRRGPLHWEHYAQFLRRWWIWADETFARGSVLPRSTM